jgi:NADH:ubiquinone oxidoreductase subunit
MGLVDIVKRGITTAAVASAMLAAPYFASPTQVYAQENTSSRENYAILINGDMTTETSESHNKNIISAADALRSAGYQEKNMIFLTGQDPRTNKSFNNYRPATKEYIASAFNDLQKKIDDNDSLLIITSGHGQNLENDENRYLVVDNTKLLSANEFITMIQGIKADEYVYISDQCFGGRFAKKIAELEGNVAAFSITDENNVASCEYFTPYFWERIRMQQEIIEVKKKNPNRMLLSFDTDDDGAKDMTIWKDQLLAKYGKGTVYTQYFVANPQDTDVINTDYDYNGTLETSLTREEIIKAGYNENVTINLDFNNDMKYEVQEIPETFGIAPKLDTNNDGVISLREFYSDSLARLKIRVRENPHEANGLSFFKGKFKTEPFTFNQRVNKR